MKRSCKVMFAALTVSGALAASGEALVWYHFDEAASGTVTKAGDVIRNSAAPADDPTRFQGIPLANLCPSNNHPATNQTKSACMPRYAESFGVNGYTWWDPLTGESGDLDRSLYFTSAGGNGGVGGYAPGSMVMIEGSECLMPTNFTVEMFFRTDGLARQVWRDLFVRENLATYGKETIAMRMQSTISGTVSSYDESFTTKVSVQPSTSNPYYPDEGNWHHVAFVVDSGTKTAKLYLDYTLYTSYQTKTFNDPPTYGSGSLYEAMTIGSPFMSWYGFFRGWIDEFRLCDEALDPTKFLRIKSKAAVRNTCADTYCYLPMNNWDTWFGVSNVVTCYSSTYFNEACIPDPPWTDIVRYSNSKPYPQPDKAIKAGDVMRGSVTNAVDVANDGSLHFVTNAGLRASAVIRCGERAYDAPLPNDSFTSEMFARFDGRPVGNTTYMMCQVSEWGVPDKTGSGGNWGVKFDERGYISAFCSDIATQKTWINVGSVQLSKDDTSWHHIAFVYDKAKKRVSFYVDYKELNTVSAELKYGSSKYYSGVNIAGGYNTAAYMHNGWVDDVRITKRALCPQEFLTRTPKATGEELFWADFENGQVAANPYPLETQGRAAAWTSTGAVPSVEATRWGRRGIEDGEGTLVRTTNGKALSVSNGMVDFGRIISLEGKENLTVELAVNLSAASVGADIIRLDDLTDENSGPVFALGVDGTGKNPCIRVDTAEEVNQCRTFSDVNLTDGRWHSLALTFAVEDDKTRVTLYDTRRKIGDFVVNGHLKASTDTRLSVGGSAAIGTSGITGMMDEVRITGRVLTTEELIGAVPFGMMLILK